MSYHLLSMIKKNHCFIFFFMGLQYTLASANSSKTWGLLQKLQHLILFRGQKGCLITRALALLLIFQETNTAVPD